MAWWLQVIIAIVLVVLCGALVPLLLQLRRTAAAVEGLAQSARADLGQIHHLRIRADGLVDLATSSLEGAVSLGRFTSGAVHAVEALLGKGGLGWLSPLLTGVKFVVNFLRRPKRRADSKEASHE